MDAVSLGPLTDAASTGDLENLKQLLAAQGPQLDEAVIEKLLLAATWAPYESIFMFLLSKYSLRSIPEEVVRGTVYSGSITRFSALLDRDPSLVNLQFDKRGTPLAVACSSRQPVDFLEFLLVAGADPNQDPEMAALPLAAVAAFYRDTAAADLLLKHGARMEGSGALQTAAAMGNEVMLRYLLGHGADREMTPAGISAAVVALHGAAKRGHAEAVRVLLDHGVDVHAKNYDGKTALEVVEEAEKKQIGEVFSDVKEVLGKS